ncbi:unnamed protein product [Diamesa tonsa]
MATAIIDLIPTDLDSKEIASATNFLQTTIRTLFFKAAVRSASEIDNKLKVITLDEVSEHYNSRDCWVVIYDRVYDITKLLNVHPGGSDVLLDYAGRDGTLSFRGTGHSQESVDALKQYEIGILPPHERIYRCAGRMRISGVLPE